MRRVLFIFFLIFPLSLMAQEGEIQRQRPQISLITCSSGDELYSIFGHSALRLYYPEDGKDLVFNFGVFDFNTPNFYSKFMKGNLKYMLAIQNMSDFVEQYIWERRGVKEQILNLSDEQNDMIVSRLEYLYRPENRYYLYSFLYKNCTSELRDIIYSVTGSNQELLNKSAGTTHRKLINQYISGWTKFGINLILGSGLDKEIDLHKSMFLPYNLYAVLNESINESMPFVKEEIVISDEYKKSKRDELFWTKLMHPLSVLSLISIVVIALFFVRGCIGWSDNLYISIFSLAGLFILALTLISDHVELHANFNLLWCNPLYLFVVLASVKKWKKTERLLSAISLVSLGILQIIWGQKIQYAEPGFFIIVITLAFSFLGRIICKWRNLIG